MISLALLIGCGDGEQPSEGEAAKAQREDATPPQPQERIGNATFSRNDLNCPGANEGITSRSVWACAGREYFKPNMGALGVLRLGDGEGTGWNLPGTGMITIIRPITGQGLPIGQLHNARLRLCGVLHPRVMRIAASGETARSSSGPRVSPRTSGSPGAGLCSPSTAGTLKAGTRWWLSLQEEESTVASGGAAGRGLDSRAGPVLSS